MRLCGARGLEPALIAAAAGRGGHQTPILPVVISRGAFAQEHATSSHRVSSGLAASSLSEGALAAIAKYYPRPCYYRIDRERLFSREAWQPVAAKVAEAGAGSSAPGKIVLVVEADSLSSDSPQTLLSSPVKSATVAGVRGGSDTGGASGGLGEDQAVWGLAMLRRALEEKRERESGRVASVLLAERRIADAEGSKTVSIDARAALLLSVFSWAQQCAAEALAQGAQASATQSRGDEMAADSPETPAALQVAEGDTEDLSRATAAKGAEGQPTVVSAAQPADADGDGDGDADANGGESRAGGVTGGAQSEAEDPSTPPPPSAAARVLGVLENMGRGVRVAVAPFGQLRSTIDRSLSTVSGWVDKNRRRASMAAKAAATSRVLCYDTDDDESFRWLAAQVKNLEGGRKGRAPWMGCSGSLWPSGG